MPTALALLTLLAADPVALAPTPADLAAAEAELSERVATAEARGEATARLQNTWVESGAPARKPCAELADVALAAQIQLEGVHWRDAAQAARASADRLRPLLVAPTLAPLLTPEATQTAQALLARVDADNTRYLEASAWSARTLGPTLKRCPPPAP